MGLEKEISDYRVSSVLNSDRKQYGKKYLFDGKDETCWNSDQGTPQWIQFNFPEPKTIKQLKLQFQGGFACTHCVLEAVESNESSSDEVAKKFEFYPRDINPLQEFVCDPPVTGQSFKLIFKSSTDFYGRIILYHLQFLDE